MRIDKIKNRIFRKIQVLPKNLIKIRFSLLPYKLSIRKTVVLRIDIKTIWVLTLLALLVRGTNYFKSPRYLKL